MKKRINTEKQLKESKDISVQTALKPFVLGNVPLDTGDRFLFNTNNNRLLFDADGTSSGGAIVVATLNNSNIISNLDIEVIG